jgi:small conductance mechanosensitive channel
MPDISTTVLLHAVYAIVIVAVGYFIAGWATGAANMALERSKLDPIVRRLIVSLVRPAVITIAVFCAIAVLGIPMTTFAAIAGAVTLAIGLSLQGSVSNVASGAMLLTLRPFDVDDTVTAGGHTGKVTALKLFVTTLETPDGNVITLPNDVVFKGPITTYTSTPNSRVDLTFVLAADTDLQKAADLVKKVLADDERILDDPGPAVVFNGATDLGIELVGRGWATNADKWGARSDIQAAILTAFQKAKIQLATRAT